MQIHVFPSDDTLLASAVEETLADLHLEDADQEVDETALRQAVATRLREAYPRLVITQQSELGRRGDEPTRWYVYRDGQVQSEERDQAWEMGSRQEAEPATGEA
jgi:hypothetical protein